METTDFCNYELSLALKAAGFNEPCAAFYEHINGKMYFSVDGTEDWNSGIDYSAPHIYHAQKWLREKKGIDALVYNCACGYTWEVSKANNGTGLILFDEKGDDENSGCWTSYEGALSASIAAALELIKKGE